MQNIIIGGAIVAGAVQLALTAVLPEQKRIEVHELTFNVATYEVVQRRTVRTDEPFFWSHWEAQIINVETGEMQCEGDGDWPYKPGYYEAVIPLKQWVGDDDCELPPGTYALRAAWLWGDDQEARKSDAFTVP